MKEKTLVERLREADADEKCTGEVFEAITGNQYYVDCRAKCTECFELALKDIADAIEHEYVSREQHEAEVKAIVEAQGCDGYSHGYPHHIMKVYADRQGMPMKEGETITEWLDRWFLLRPRYKDGGPVQFGDDVCYKHFQLGCPVDTIAFSDNGVCEVFGEGNSISMIPSVEEFERPDPKVYDADGVECLAGHIVWDKSGKKLAILSVKSEDDIYVLEDDGSHRVIAAKFLTHREPDSFEKLRDRMHSKWSRAWAEGESITEGDLHGFVDDLTALIERGARWKPSSKK